MRVAYMVGGYSSSNDIFLHKFLQYGVETHVIYTRPAPADSEVLKRVNASWVNVGRFGFLPKALRWLIFTYDVIRLVRKIKPDVILSQGIQAHGIFSVLSGIRPVLLMPWGTDWAITAHKNIAMRMLSRYVVNHVGLVQIDCDVGKRTVMDLSGGKVRPEQIWVFPQGIELNIFRPRPEARMAVRDKLRWSDKKILVMTRQLKSIYGVDIFIKALEIVVRTQPNVRALIVGEGPLEAELKELIVLLKLSEFVKFIGRVDREELVNYLNAGDVYVSTSYSDGTSLCLLEAMATGLPAVVTDVPANLEWIENGHNGFTPARGNPREVAYALLKLLEDSDLCEMFGTRNLAIAKERADWDKNFEMFLKMFDLLLRRGSRIPASWVSSEHPSSGV
jgi:glycosyltransferase involved in cell wall biosynthesis